MTKPYAQEEPGARGSRTKTLVPALLREAGSGARAGWRGLSGRGRIESGLILLTGFLLCAALSYGVSSWAKALEPQGLGAWDRHCLQWAEAHGPLSFVDAILFESPGNLSYLFPLTTIVAVLAFRARRFLFGLGVLLAYWGARPLIQLGWQAWDRARPDLIADGVAAPGLHSFPSGHAGLSSATYGFLAWLWIRHTRSGVERAVAVFVTALWVLLVSWSRVRLGAHWPSDLLAGWLVGLTWLAVVIIALRRAERHAVIQREGR